MSKICQECCQLTKYGCYCVNGVISVKYIGSVSGCVKFDNNKRCKSNCETNGICEYHINQVSEDNKNYIKSIFN